MVIENEIKADAERQKSLTPTAKNLTLDLGMSRSLTPTNLKRVPFEKTYSPSIKYDQPAGQAIPRISSRKKAVE